jgi:hypothetical protein
MTRYRVVEGRSRVEVAVRTTVGPIALTAEEVSGAFEAERSEHGVFLAVTRPTCRIEVPVRALHSGNWLFDREGRRRFDARRHPLVVAELVGAIPRSGGEHWVAWRLTFHGRTRDLMGAMRVADAAANAIRIRGCESFDVREWGVEPGGRLGVKVEPQADFTVDLFAVAGPDAADQ